MSYHLCRHIRTNGRRCKAASLQGNIWCFYHQRLHATHQAFRQTEATRGYLIPGQNIELTTLEDRESIQLALSVVINSLATGHLDTKRATALLYGLQVASSNAANLDSQPGREAVRILNASPEGLDIAEPAIHHPSTLNPARDDDDDNDDDEEEHGEHPDHLDEALPQSLAIGDPAKPLE